MKLIVFNYFKWISYYLTQPIDNALVFLYIDDIDGLPESPREPKRQKEVSFSDERDDSDYFTPPSSAEGKTRLKRSGLEDDQESPHIEREEEGTDDEEEETDEEMENFTAKLKALKVCPNEKKLILPHLMYNAVLDSCGKTVLCIDVELPAGADENDVHFEFVESEKGRKQKLLVKYLYSFPFLSMRIFEAALDNTRDEVAIAFARKTKIRESMKATDQALVTPNRQKHIYSVMEITLPFKCVNFSDNSVVQINGTGVNINRYVYGDDDDPAEMLCANIVLVAKEERKRNQNTPQRVRNHAVNGLGLDDLKREFEDF